MVDLYHLQLLHKHVTGYVCYLCGKVGKWEDFPVMTCCACVFFICIKCLPKWEGPCPEDSAVIALLSQSVNFT